MENRGRERFFLRFPQPRSWPNPPLLFIIMSFRSELCCSLWRPRGDGRSRQAESVTDFHWLEFDSWHKSSTAVQIHWLALVFLALFFFFRRWGRRSCSSNARHTSPTSTSLQSNRYPSVISTTFRDWVWIAVTATPQSRSPVLRAFLPPRRA